MPFFHSSKWSTTFLVCGFDVGQELLVELLGLDFQFLADHGGGVVAVAEIVHHGEQRVPAPLLGDVIDRFAGLEIADDHLRGYVGMDEAAVELGDRQQLLVP